MRGEGKGEMGKKGKATIFQRYTGNDDPFATPGARTTRYVILRSSATKDPPGASAEPLGLDARGILRFAQNDIPIESLPIFSFPFASVRNESHRWIDEVL